MPGELDPRHVLARTRLLDALGALGPHQAGLTLVGAQAVYFRTGPVKLPVEPFTEDGDLALDPTLIASEPLIEVAMASRGFVRTDQPGAWLSVDRIPVDLLVPAGVAGKGTRSVDLPPHDRMAMRRAAGLEGALVDRTIETIAGLDDSDSRSHRIGVAGPAALLIAKAHKLGERFSGKATRPDRVLPKDALDIHRLMLAYDPDVLARGLTVMQADPRSCAATNKGLEYLASLFDPLKPIGAELVAEALWPTMDREIVIAASGGLVRRLLAMFGSRP